MEVLVETLHHVVSWIGRNSLETTWLIAGVLVLTATFGRHLSTGLRTCLWGLVALRLILPFAPPSSFSVHNLLPSRETPPFLEASPRPVAGDTLSNAPAGPVFTKTDSGKAASSLLPTTLPDTSPRLSWKPFIAVAWALGFFGVLGFARIRLVATRRVVTRLPHEDREELKELLETCRRQTRTKRRLQLVQGPPGTGVAVFGGFRETHLIIPADFTERYSDNERQGILLHEFAHVRRHDLALNWIVLFLQALHWFNPLVWIAGRRFLAEREVLCDRAALRGLPDKERRDYGAALLKALSPGKIPHSSPALVPFISRKSELEHRLTMITNPRTGNLTLQWLAAVLAGAVVLATFTSAVADEKRSEADETRRESPRDGDRESERPRGEGERESAERREGDRPRDGERDGDRPREGARDGESDRPREGMRDGDRPREGARDGDRPREGDLRDGSDSDADLHVSVRRTGVSLGDRQFSSLADFRSGLRGVSGKSVLLTAEPNTPFKTVTAVVNTLRSAGIEKVSFATREEPGERDFARDGDRSREGMRDGDRPREGAGDREGERGRTGAQDRDRDGEMRRAGEGAGDREGERPREGARDGEGERSREGAGDGDRDREREMRRGGEGDRARAGDTDSSGVDDRELAKLTRIYRVYDKDENGGVSFEEWIAMKNYELSAAQEKREKGWFDQADANSDGKVTLGEWIDWKTSQ